MHHVSSPSICAASPKETHDEQHSHQSTHPCHLGGAGPPGWPAGLRGLALGAVGPSGCHSGQSRRESAAPSRFWSGQCRGAAGLPHRSDGAREIASIECRSGRHGQGRPAAGRDGSGRQRRPTAFPGGRGQARCRNVRGCDGTPHSRCHPGAQV